MKNIFKLQFVFAALIALSSILVVPFTVNAALDLSKVPQAYKGCVPQITNVVYEPKDGKLKTRDQAITVTTTIQTSGCIIGVEGSDSLWYGWIGVLEADKSYESWSGFQIPNRGTYIKGSDFKRISSNESSPDYNKYRAVYKRSIVFLERLTVDDMTVRPTIEWNGSVVSFDNKYDFTFTAPPLSAADASATASAGITNAGGYDGMDGKIPTIDSPVTGGATTLPELMARIIQYALGLIAMVAIVVIILAGFRMIAGSGDENQRKIAKRSITWAIIGLVLALLSFSIVTIIQSVLYRQP